MNRLKHLKEECARKEAEMTAIFKLCETEKRNRTADESTKWAGLKVEADNLRTEIKDLEEQEAIDARSAKPVLSDEKPKPQGADQPMTLRQQLEKFMTENRATIEAIREGEQRPLPELVIRAAANPMTITTVNSGSSAFLPNAGGINGPINDLNRTRPTFWNRLVKGRTNLNPYVWANKTNKQGNATFIGEGVLKNLASFEITVETSTAKKVAERFRVSTELLNDIDGLQSLIENEARFEVEVAANTASLTGTLSSTSPAGITTLASAFNMPNQINIKTPTKLDAIRAAIAQLTTLNFTRNIVAFINPVDAAAMDMDKGTDGHYMIPPFTSSNGLTLKGVEIVEDLNIPIGKLLIGDMSKYKVLMVQDFFVRWGYDSDDFSKNLITMIAEMRFHAFRGANDAGAFIYDDFTTIQAAIFTT